VVRDTDAKHVQNKEDPDASTPLKAHAQYWNGKILGTVLYNAVK